MQLPPVLEHVTRSEAATAEVARDLASTLTPGAVLLVSGELGAGKTVFVRGVAEGLGADPEEVCSPTFTLLHEYRGGRLTLHHADLYRLEAGAAEDLGLDEVIASGGVLAIEWPDRLVAPPPDAIHVGLEILDADTRRIRYSSR